MTTKLEALCQLADANAALAGSQMVMDGVGLKLEPEDIAAMAAEIRELTGRLETATIAFNSLMEVTGGQVTGPGTDAAGWIEWKGGECPVDPEMRVDMRMRNLSVRTAVRATDSSWHHPWNGRESDRAYDIVAYRLAQN